MRRSLSFLVVTLLASFSATGQVNIITTIAGGAAQPGPAAAAYLPQPTSVVRDSAGNTYIAVPALYTVYVVSTSGTMSVYAGTGIEGFSGDGGPANQAQLAFPEGLAIDSANNLYIADTYNERIRRVDAQTHIITTVAGSEDPFFGAYGGDGGPATNARLSSPTDVAVDANGNLFIADNGNGVVRRVAAATQVITTYAGSNPTLDVSAGCNTGSAANAAFSNLIGVAVDSSGNVFASDTKLDVVCKIDTTQTVSLYAGAIGNPGTPGAANGDGGPAASAQIDRPTGLATDAAGNLYITDSGNPRIRRVDTSASHTISSVAGTGTICPTTSEFGCGDGGPATAAAFDFPNGVFVDANNNILVADTNNMRVRVVSATANSTITNLAGSGSGGDDGPATGAILGAVQALAVDANENVFALETAGERLREVANSGGDINTIAGTGFGGASRNCPGPSCNGDGGPATAAQFVEPAGFAIDGQGNYFIVDPKAEVVRVINNQTSPQTFGGVTVQPGYIATVAGNGTSCTSAGSFPTCGDAGPALSANLERPFGVAVDAGGNIYISDQALHTVRVINSTGTINTFAGTPGQACTGYNSSNCGDGGSPTAGGALLNSPSGLAVSPTISQGVPQLFNSDVFIADTGDNAIRKVHITSGTAVSETISNAAFNGLPTFGGDGAFAGGEASMEAPLFVAVDNFENLYVGGGADNVVRRIDAFSNGQTSTVAGDVNNLDGGFSGDFGPSTQAMIGNTGLAVATTPQGTHDIFIADTGSNRIRKVNLAPVGSIFPSSGTTITFPVTLVNQTNTQSIFLENKGLDDLVISKLSLSDTTDFSVTSSSCSGTNPLFVVPPLNSLLGFSACTFDVNFTPGPNANGPITATLTFSTNDAASPSFSYTLSGTATPTAFTLTVTSLTPPIGSGPGGSVSSGPGGIDCSTSQTGSCNFNFPSGTIVTLFANADPNFNFTSWDATGACASAGTNPVCQVTMDQPQNVSATFTSTGQPPPPPTPQMIIKIVGFGNASGTISDGANFNCTITNGVAGANCSSMPYMASVGTVTLTATPGSPTFVGWLGGQCFPYNQSPCTIGFTNGTVTLGAVFSGPPQTFASGQVFLSTDFGMVFVLDGATGNVVQVLSSGNTSGQGQGMTFDDVGSLYLANSSANQVEQFAMKGTGPATFGSGFSRPWSPVIEPSGGLLVGQLATLCDCSVFFPPAVLQFPQGASSTTGASATFYPAFETFFPPVNWIELLDSGDTIAYTNGGQTVRVYDLGERTQHPDMITTLNAAYALRELPDDTLLVADTGRIVRIDQGGSIKQIYTVPSTEATFINLNLDPDGQSFWTNDQDTGILYRINIQTGAVMNGTGYSTGLGRFGLSTGGIGGIAVFGQALSGGADLAVTMAAPSSVQFGANVTYSVTVSNSGPLNSTGVTVVANIPNSAPVSLAAGCASTPNGTGTTVSCTIGSVTANAALTSLNFTMAPTASGTITATATVSGLQSDPNLANNTATAITNVAAQTLAPSCTLGVSPTSGTAPLTVTATSNCTDTNSTITSTTINFGDGSGPQTETSGPHTYTVAGTFTVTVIATNAAGQQGSATQPVTVSGNFPQGVYIGVSGGKIMQFDSTGKALQTLDTTLGGTIADMAFDKAGNLYSVDFTAANVSKFNLTSGTLTGTFGSGYDCQPESMVFDGAGNAYVGQQGCAQTILKFDPKGNFLTSYQVATEQQGSDDLALSADECTMLYTSEGTSILRYDVCQKKQLSPFATGLNTALQLKILPDGGVLVADLTDIVRFNSSGQRMTTYTIPNQSCLYGIALDQDGTTFWADDYCSSNIDHIDISSGKVLSTFNTGTPSGTVFGLAIAGSGLNVAGVGSGGSLTASPQSATLSAGQSATFTVTFTPNAAAAGRTVVLSCAGLPPGLTCSFNPPTITLGAAGTPSTATLTIARTTTAALLHPSSPWMLATWIGVVPAIVLMGIRSPRRRSSSMICLALVVAATGIWASCGGGGTNNMNTQTPTTPPGSYTIIVVGNASGVQVSTTVNVTAQ